jgi:FkbM family methyltransferase
MPLSGSLSGYSETQLPQRPLQSYCHIFVYLYTSSERLRCSADHTGANRYLRFYRSRASFMLKSKISTARRLFREKGFRGVASHGWYTLRAKRSSVRLDNSRFGLEGIHEVSKAAMLTNAYELPERRAVARYLRPNLPVVELGGSIGVVACVTNKLLIDRTAHLVVEANPHAIPHLERNRESNRCKFEIMNCAIAYGSSTVTFRPSSDMCGNSVTASGDESPVTIPTARLRDLLLRRGFGRFTLVCDIEGMEYEMVCHEADVLKNADTIIMETHARLIGEHKLSSMMTRLKDLGFRVVEETGFVVVLQA